MDEPKVEYTVKEMFHHLGGKIDKLDEKVDTFMDRIAALEAGTVAREQFEANAVKTKWALYGILITGAGVVGDAILHFMGKK